MDLFIDGQQISANEYLEKTLAPLPGSGDDILSKNRVRNTIKEYFRDRRCFTLKRPVSDEEKLQEIDKCMLQFELHILSLIYFCHFSSKARRLSTRVS